MVIETNDYLYYTVIDVHSWIRENENMLNEDLNTQEIIDFIEKKFKQSEDKTVNNFRVDNAKYCQDINIWIETFIDTYTCPVFVRFHEDQQIKLNGSGQLFVLYQLDDDGNDLNNDGSIRYINSYPDGFYDGLEGHGGRL